MLRRPDRWLRLAPLSIATTFAFSGCARLLQNNLEVLFAPEVLTNGFLLPFTFVFRLLTRGGI